MNLPNQLTLGRFVITMVFVAVLSMPIPFRYTIGAWLFIIAAITDYLDGHIARKYGLVTNFGKLMDPLVDKILIAAAFIILATIDNLVPAWVVIVVLAREFLVTGLRLIASAQGAILSADRLGKWKTTFQITTAIYLLIYLASKETPMALFRYVYDIPLMGPYEMGALLVALTLLSTVVSGFNYLWNNRHLIDMR